MMYFAIIHLLGIDLLILVIFVLMWFNNNKTITNFYESGLKSRIKHEKS
jgi:hypothetical protein